MGEGRAYDIVLLQARGRTPESLRGMFWGAAMILREHVICHVFNIYATSGILVDDLRRHRLALSKRSNRDGRGAGVRLYARRLFVPFFVTSSNISYFLWLTLSAS